MDVTVAPGDPIPALHRAELLVLPSLEDGFGFVVPEGMACELPVVVTERCGAAEWVEPGRTGWVILAGEIDPLEAALSSALFERANLRTMGAAAREVVLARG